MISKKNGKFICKRLLTTHNLLYQKYGKKVMEYSHTVVSFKTQKKKKKEDNKTQALKKI